MKSHFLLRPKGLCLAALVLGQALAGAAQARSEPDRAVASVEVADAAALPDSRGAAAAPATAALPPMAYPWRQRSINVGSATEDLLALQRAAVSAHPRNIDGEQASRSYQRYLKSFETNIPERYDTGLDLKRE